MTQNMTKRVETGARYLTREGKPVGPVDRIDVNGWAWIGDNCWDAQTGRFYANIDDGRDMVTLISGKEFQHWQEWMGSASEPAMEDAA